jgi:hypothetical protein
MMSSTATISEIMAGWQLMRLGRRRLSAQKHGWLQLIRRSRRQRCELQDGEASRQLYKVTLAKLEPVVGKLKTENDFISRIAQA